MKYDWENSRGRRISNVFLLSLLLLHSFCSFTISLSPFSFCLEIFVIFHGDLLGDKFFSILIWECLISPLSLNNIFAGYGICVNTYFLSVLENIEQFLSGFCGFWREKHFYSSCFSMGKVSFLSCYFQDFCCFHFSFQKFDWFVLVWIPLYFYFLGLLSCLNL